MQRTYTTPEIERMRVAIDCREELLTSCPDPYQPGRENLLDELLRVQMESGTEPEELETALNDALNK